MGDLTIAVVTDSASDLPPEAALATGSGSFPLNVHFAGQGFRAGVGLSSADFWARMLQPDAHFPTTSAASPAAFQDAFEAAFAGGARAIVCVDVSETLSGTIKSAPIAAGLMPDREIHVVNSHSASMGIGLLALLASDLAREGHQASEIVELLDRRAPDIDLLVALDARSTSVAADLWLGVRRHSGEGAVHEAWAILGRGFRVARRPGSGPLGPRAACR